MDDAVGKREALILGLGNVLWADEGFGVRAVEALHARFAFDDGVALQDGGTLGLLLLDAVATTRRLLVFDAVDASEPAGTLVVLRDDEVPAWGRAKLSPHQTGFNDVLAHAALRGATPSSITVIGVQPAVLDDFGGSLSEPVRARLADAVALGVAELAAWGIAACPRAPDEVVEPVTAPSLALGAYEHGRPSPEAACRIGDPRVLAMRRDDTDRSCA